MLYNINEALSISDEVLQQSDKLCQIIRDKVNQELENIDIEKYVIGNNIGNYINIRFEHNIYNQIYTIIVKNYIKFNINYLDELSGNANVINKTITLDIIIDNPTYFENIVTHEILHIYQYNKNQQDYANNDKLYKILNYIRKNIENYNDLDILFAQALYISYSFEQDAMIHGLYKNLQQYATDIIQFRLKETDEYRFLVDLRYAIKNIDLFNESLFDNKLSKSAFLHRLEKAKQRYSTKINHIVQRIFDSREHLNEMIPHRPHISPKKLKEIFEKYEIYDNSEKHLNAVKEILKIE